MRWLPWLATVGCAVESVQGDGAPESPAPVDVGEDADPPAGTPPPETDRLEEPRFQAFQLVLTVDDVGEVAVADVAISWSLANVGAEEICRESPVVTAVAIEAPATDETEVLGAWSLELADDPLSACGLSTPETLSVAIRLPDPRLTSAVDAAEDLAGQTYYSYAIRLGEAGPRTLHGVATTQDLLDDKAVPVEALPLPADTYTLEPLLYLDLPE